MSGVDNMNYMYSLNASTGEMRLIVDFDVQTDPNTDLILAQMRETQAASQLPAEVTNFGVTVQKSLTAPLMLIGLYSPNGTYDAKFLANYAYINLNDQLTRVPGIGSVQVFGAGQYAMRLWVKPDQLAKLGITVPEIVTAIQAQNTVNPAGQVGGEPAPQGAGIHLLGARAGPADVARGVRADRRPRDSGRRDRARQGRRAGRTGRAGLQRHRPPERTSRARSSPSISCRDRTPCKRPTASRSCWPSRSSASRTTWTTRSRSTPRARSPKASRRSSRRC